MKQIKQREILHLVQCDIHRAHLVSPWRPVYALVVG